MPWQGVLSPVVGQKRWLCESAHVSRDDIGRAQSGKQEGKRPELQDVAKACRGSTMSSVPTGLAEDPVQEREGYCPYPFPPFFSVTQHFLSLSVVQNEMICTLRSLQTIKAYTSPKYIW